MLFIFTSMGMPIQITYEGEEDGVLQTQIEILFNKIDAEFSTYKDSSAVSKFNANDMSLVNQSDAFTEVYEACAAWRVRTYGYFDPYYAKTYDPSGYVKAYAIAQTKALLDSAQISTYSINASGDILTKSNGVKKWMVGIQHPYDKHKTIGALSVQDLAIATSGNYERGSHIVNPKTKLATTSLTSITVIGKDIITADVLATAAFASDKQWKTFMDSFSGYEALAITRDGTVKMTPGFAALAT